MNPVNLALGTAVGMGKGFLDGAKIGIESGNNGNIFDIVTVPVGAVAGAATGSVIGTSAGIASGIFHTFDLNPMPTIDDAVEMMDKSKLVERVVLPLSKVASGATIGGLAAATGGAVIGASIVACAASGAVAGAVREFGSTKLKELKHHNHSENDYLKNKTKDSSK